MSDAQREVSSSTVLFSVATAFLVLAALVGFLDGGDGPTGATWKLRGTLIPAAEASAAQGGR